MDVGLIIRLTSKGSVQGADWTILGDEVLVQVVAAVVYGIKQPSALFFHTLGGFSESQVATGIALVCLSLQI